MAVKKPVPVPPPLGKNRTAYLREDLEAIWRFWWSTRTWTRPFVESARDKGVSLRYWRQKYQRRGNPHSVFLPSPDILVWARSSAKLLSGRRDPRWGRVVPRSPARSGNITLLTPQALLRQLAPVERLAHQISPDGGGELSPDQVKQVVAHIGQVAGFRGEAVRLFALLRSWGMDIGHFRVRWGTSVEEPYKKRTPAERIQRLEEVYLSGREANRFRSAESRARQEVGIYGEVYRKRYEQWTRLREAGRNALPPKTRVELLRELLKQAEFEERGEAEGE